MSSAFARAVRPRPAWALAIPLALAAVSLRADTPVPQTVTTIQSAAADSLSLSGCVVYVDFWASWCVPCRESFPWMTTMLERYRGRGLRIVTVNVDRDPAAAEKFLKKMNASLPVVYDSKGALAKQYRLEVMPTSFIYGRDGTLKDRHEGFHPDDTADREALITTLLEEKPKQ